MSALGEVHPASGRQFAGHSDNAPDKESVGFIAALQAQALSRGAHQLMGMNARGGRLGSPQ